MRSRYIVLSISLTGCLAVAACGGGGGGGGKPATTPAPSAPAARPPAAPAGRGVTGSASVTGTVRYEGAVPALQPIRMDADPACAKKHGEPVKPDMLVLGEGNTLGNAFVRVKSGLPAGEYAAPPQAVVLDQLGCRYSPHVVGVMVGQPFKIRNSDGLLHNVHGLPEVNPSFNRAMPAAVIEADYVFDKAEAPFRVKCDVHPWMGAWVGVMPHPFYEVTGKSGTFGLTGLPAGTYEVEAWHERLGALTEQVTLADGEVGQVAFVFKR